MSAVSNARWIAISQASRIGMQLIGLVVLARLLPPGEFGLMAMATVVINFAYLLRDMGTAAAVVQKESLTENTINTVFWLNVGLGLSLGIGLLAVAPLIAEGFHSPRLIPVLWVLALVFPVTSAAAVHQALLERESRFRLLARIEILSSFAGLIVALSLAYAGFGVFSLAYQALAAAIFSSSQLWIASRWTPKMQWSNAEFKSLWRFSGHLTGFSFINFFARNADSMIIGRVLGAASLGIYSQAYKVMMFPLQSMTAVASRALFPVMSRQQNDVEQMAKLYFRSLRLIAAITAPLMAGLWVLREPFVEVALGKQWAEVAIILAWLAPVGFIQSLTSTTGAVFMAIGRTDLLMRLGLIGCVLQVGAFFIGIRWGIEGVAACYLVANILNALPCYALTLKQLNCNFSDLLNAIWKPFVFAFFMLGVLAPVLRVLLMEGAGTPVVLIVSILLGVLVYVLLMHIFAKEISKDVVMILGRR
jgi:PST family polysaccharide transporter